MDVSTLGGLLAGVATAVGAVVAFLGKRGETALSGYTSLTDQLQEERTAQQAEITDLRRQLTERNTVLAAQAAQLAEQASLRAADQAEIALLRGRIIQLGGTP